MTEDDAKLDWQGEVVSVQPRIRLTRSFDQRGHSYLGYVLRVRGTLDGEAQEFVVAIGKAAQAKHSFRVGDTVKGSGEFVDDERLETADLYKVSRLKLLARSPQEPEAAPPFRGVPPSLEVYRERGDRRLAARTYAAKCTSCIWGCKMAVELIVDHWKPSNVRYRRETFCYGPKRCPNYAAGPTRKAPGRNGMSWEEPGWVDEEATAHRSLHE